MVSSPFRTMENSLFAGFLTVLVGKLIFEVKSKSSSVIAGMSKSDSLGDVAGISIGDMT